MLTHARAPPPRRPAAKLLFRDFIETLQLLYMLAHGLMINIIYLVFIYRIYLLFISISLPKMIK